MHLPLLFARRYITAYPIAFVLNWFDVDTKHATGTGLIVKAWK